MKITMPKNTEIFKKTWKQTKRAVPGKKVLFRLFTPTRKGIGQLIETNQWKLLY